MKLRPLTEKESLIVSHIGAKYLSTKDKDKFDSCAAFMNAWVTVRAPQWKDVQPGDLVRLTTESDQKSDYYVHSIILASDMIRFSKVKDGYGYPPRDISDMPYMKVLTKAKPIKTQENKSLF